ncbi:hypothetical protein GT755_34735 [Herbidospora sp. NEAU-GS84]|uniref:Uncharacterized protein n=1 Tax=Herbidospora solisilvae TaxID=2696284 RepID=A0A7C9N705_9ACTN|nr:hypothetical protein [Herbidospora solisilvae]NAS26814.1 hypothetical protein [Herbidospora solisilvae]
MVDELTPDDVSPQPSPGHAPPGSSSRSPRWPPPVPSAAMVRLAHALASADGEALRARYSEAIAGTPVMLTGIPSPVAPATAAGLHILHLMLESETDLILKAGA